MNIKEKVYITIDNKPLQQIWATFSIKDRDKVYKQVWNYIRDMVWWEVRDKILEKIEEILNES